MSGRSVLLSVFLAEGLVTERVFCELGTDGVAALGGANAFGDEILVEKGADFEAMVLRAKDSAESGLRTTLIGSATALLGRRPALRALVLSRLGVVVHVLADADAMRGAVHALSDLGFGMLFSSGPQDSFDLTLIARRAAEDSGVPFFVVHEHGAHGAFEAVSQPDRERIAAYVGAARARLVKVSNPTHPVHVAAEERAYARRASFALGAAMRELEGVSGRRHDVIERVNGEADLVLAGIGVVGDALLGVAERSRETAHPIGALKVTALRPLDGPRIVKALARAHAVTVIEAAFDPLTETMPLARELKAAFADAITWAPGYPGIGRVPRFTSAVLPRQGLTDADIASAIANMREGESAVRSFTFGEEGAPRVPPPQGASDAGPPRIRVHSSHDPSKVASYILSAVSSAIGLRGRAVVRAVEDGGRCIDVCVSRESPRVEPTRSRFDWVLRAEDEPAAATAAIAAAFLAHAHRAIVDGPAIARAIRDASGDDSDEAIARAAVDSGRWRSRAG